MYGGGFGDPALGNSRAQSQLSLSEASHLVGGKKKGRKNDAKKVKKRWADLGESKGKHRRAKAWVGLAHGGFSQQGSR